MVVVGVLLVGFAFLLIFSWWTEGYIGAIDALMLYALYGGLIFGLFAADTMLLRSLVLIPLLISGAWGGYAVKMGSLRQYYRDQVKVYRKAIDTDPRNLSARRQLAEALYKVGDIDMAVAELKLLIEMSPVKTEERYLLRQWEEEQRLRHTGTAVCHHCGTENERGISFCKRCERPLLRYGQKSWLSQAGLKGFLTAFGALSIIALTIVFLPHIYIVIPAACLLLMIVGWRISKQ